MDKPSSKWRWGYFLALWGRLCHAKARKLILCELGVAVEVGLPALFFG